MKKLFIFTILSVVVFSITACNDDSELKKKQNDYLDKINDAESNHKKFGEEKKMNIDWMKNIKNGTDNSNKKDLKNLKGEKNE